MNEEVKNYECETSQTVMEIDTPSQSTSVDKNGSDSSKAVETANKVADVVKVGINIAVAIGGAIFTILKLKDEHEISTTERAIKKAKKERELTWERRKSNIVNFGNKSKK